ncbi:MAG TPA: Stp1/IreP family PP2C-type Ser/Thr phosphatase [Acidimicrobiales bacterium]|nr:Stp1/IreP family PP2C-type Ser/Thr phosphatase [Acidimicrobiales bacterium]
MTSLRSGAATDTGQVRANNQDAVLIAEPLFAVADGMGGHAAGEIASQVAVESLQDSAVSSLDSLVEAVRDANRSVWQRASEDPELHGMGTTLCAIALVPGEDDGEQIVVVNVGDSRVYQLHDGELTQLTDDHSLVEDLVREGRLSPQEARTHPQRNILTRVLGNDSDVEVDSWLVDPHRGDRFLLCSDGLFNEVDDDKIASVLRRLADPDDAAQELVTLAIQAGGRDNVSVVVVDVVDDHRPAAAAATAVAGAPTATVGRPGDTASMPAVEPSEETRGGGGGGAPAPAPAGAAPASARASAEPAPSSRRVTWRSVLFVTGVVAVLVGAASAVAWYARSTYHVGVRGDQVAILRGRPGGLLWIQPTLAEWTDLSLDDVPDGRRNAVLRGKEEPSLAAARDYVESLEDQAEAERRRTTTTTTTSTTLPPPPAPPPSR